MSVRCEPTGDAVVLRVSGQVDMHTSPELRGELRKALDARRHLIVVDLSEVAFIDSSGLATLIEALQGARKYDARLCLCGLAPAVENLFRLSKLTSIFDVRASCEDALQP